MTTKADKLADSNDGARALEWLLDCIEGEDRPTRGNGTYRPEDDGTTAGDRQQKDRPR